MFVLAIFFGYIQLDAEREIVHTVLLKYSVTLNAALNQWRSIHSLFQQCTVKEIKAFYVWGDFCGFVAFFCLLVLFLWLDWFGLGFWFFNEEDLSVCMSSVEWPMENLFSVMEAITW